jgi:prolyl-tRNA synthetase
MRATEDPIATLRDAPAGVRGEADRLLTRGGYLVRTEDGSLALTALGERILGRARGLDPGAVGLDVIRARERSGALLSVVTLDDGDLRLLVCPSCGDAATLAAASRRTPEPVAPDLEVVLDVVPTPGATTMRTAADALGLPVEANLKTMAYEVDGRLLLAIVPGDRAVDEGKLGAVVAPAPLSRLDEEGFARRQLSKGFLGPQGHPEATIVADHGVAARPWWAAGANLDDHHVTGLVIGRDAVVAIWSDLVPAREGDPCPVCGSPLEARRGLAVARDGVVDPEALVRATAIRCADEKGPVWPRAIAPFEVTIVLATPDDPEAAAAAADLHDALEAGGATVYLDDRAERAGRKFADADLLGSPLRATVGARGVADGVGDLTLRHTGDTAQVALTELSEEILGGLDRLP